MLRVLNGNIKKGQMFLYPVSMATKLGNTIAKLEKTLIYGIKCTTNTNKQTLVNTAYKASIHT